LGDLSQDSGGLKALLPNLGRPLIISARLRGDTGLGKSKDDAMGYPQDRLIKFEL
jgi:hypothetical protein